jgi:putative transposase
MISSKLLTPMVVEAFTEFAAQGLIELNPVLEKLFNELMKAEREAVLEAKPYERTEERKGYANGFKDKKLQLRSGKIDLKVPQTREIPFYPSCLERGQRTEKALVVAVAEMYFNGVSTRKVEHITKQLCDMEISPTQVSRIAKQLDEELELFRSRPLGGMTYVYLDAHYEKVRHEGQVRDLAVLKAIGVTPSGTREILGVSCSLSEATVHWRSFLESLLSRGLRGMKLITSDDHSGLRAALKAVLPSVPWQRCIFHLAQNAQSYTPTKAMRYEIGRAVKDIYDSISREEAEERMKQVCKRFEKKASKFCEWLEENFSEGLSFFSFPRVHWKKIRTVNMVERQNQEVRRRTRVVRVFPNEESCLRLVTAVLMDQHEDWAGGKRYMTIED